MQLHACEWAEAPAATYCISRPAARAARALIALRARRSRRKRGQSRTTKGRRVSTYSTYLHTYVHPAHRPDAVAVSFLVFFSSFPRFRRSFLRIGTREARGIYCFSKILLEEEIISFFPSHARHRRQATRVGFLDEEGKRERRLDVA